MKKIVSNYKMLLDEINEEVQEGVLSENDNIQILRETSAVMDTYYPISDWYYDTFVMDEELNTPLEEMYLPEEFSEDEWKQMKLEQEETKKQYEEDQPKLVSMKVKDVLTEMKQMVKLLK